MTTQEPAISPDPAKIAKLRHALDEYAAGNSERVFFDVAEEENKAKVRSRALLLLEHRARSRKELYDRLVENAFPPAIVDKVLDDLAGVGLIDDAVFAREWVRQRHVSRGKSARALDLELKSKGVAQRDRESALAQVTQDSEQEIARSLAEKKARTIKEAPSDRQERDKALRRIVGVLARRGFGQSDSLRVAIEVLDERIAQLEEES